MATKLFEIDGFGSWQLDAGGEEVTINRPLNVQGSGGNDDITVTNVGELSSINGLDGADTIDVRSYATGVEVSTVNLGDPAVGPDGQADTAIVNGDIFTSVGFGRTLSVSGFGASDRLTLQGVPADQVELVLNIPQTTEDGAVIDPVDTTIFIGDSSVVISSGTDGQEPFSSEADFLNRVTFTAGGTPNFEGEPSEGGENLSGDAGDNFLTGSSGGDTISGAGGNDELTGGNGNDEVYGNQGDDQIYGNAGDDFVFGGQGNDFVFGGQGIDEVYGNLGADEIYGNKGNDLLFGGQDDDLLFGGEGSDQLFGNKGDDSLWGNLGDDVMNGGTGADEFVLNGGGSDRIQDFDASEGDRFGHFSGFDSFDLTDVANGFRVDWQAGSDSGQVILEGLDRADFADTWLL